MYFESIYAAVATENSSKYWPLLWSAPNAFVRYGLAVNEVSVVLKKSGTDIRVPRKHWLPWLGGEWVKQSRPGLEYEAVLAVLPHLQKLHLPDLKLGPQ